VIERFFDTNILIYLLSADQRKADLAENLLVDGGCVSVQVLNEFAAVATRKFGLSLDEVDEFLHPIVTTLSVFSVTLAIHRKGLVLAKQYSISVYDAFIVAAALDGNCKVLYSEDFHHGQLIEKNLKVINPFI
jgi:predicted nucleic acid-binding protein